MEPSLGSSDSNWIVLGGKKKKASIGGEGWILKSEINLIILENSNIIVYGITYMKACWHLLILDCLNLYE